MAMTTCHACSKGVALDAATCPSCGAPEPGQGGAERNAAVKQREDERIAEMTRGAKVVGVIFAVALVVLLLVALVTR